MLNTVLIPCGRIRQIPIVVLDVEQFTDAVIRAVNAQDRPIVFLLWGRPSQMKKSMLNNPKHLILEAPHPSPLSAYRGFSDVSISVRRNAFLEKNGIEPIDWQIEDV